MDRIDLTRCGCQPERLGTYVKKSSCPCEVEPRLDPVGCRTIDKDAMVGSKRSDALTRPAIVVTGPQLIPIKNARDEIVVGDEHQLPDGIDDIGRGGIALATAPPGQA
jgi:hypothetical protein